MNSFLENKGLVSVMSPQCSTITNSLPLILSARLSTRHLIGYSWTDLQSQEIDKRIVELCDTGNEHTVGDTCKVRR